MPNSPLNISNNFQTQSGNVPASQLDTNFQQLANAYNSLANFGNYFLDSGTVNALAIAVPSPLIVAYIAGLPVQVLVANTNTGACTININSLGPANIVNPGGGALTANQLVAGSIAPLIFDGTNFEFMGPVAQTTPSGSANLVYATPNGSAGGATLRQLTLADLPGGAVTMTSGSFTGTLGAVAGTVTGTLNYRIISNVTASIVTLYAPNSIVGTSNTTAALFVTGLPAAINPSTNNPGIVTAVTIGAGTQIALAQVSANIVQFNLYVVSGSQIIGGLYPATGNKGIFSGWTITYSL